MNIYWTFGMLGFILLCQESSSGTLCLSCNDLTEGELCTRVEMCKNDEVCFIQKYSANGNDYRYDVGCSYPELCRKDLTGHVLGRRSDHSHVICHKCCNNSDTCNVRLSCNDKVDVLPQKCLSCSEIADPRMCKNITTCATNEVCYLHKYTTYAEQQRYDLGCKNSALCTHGYLNILGRRSSFGVHQECESCCKDTALCNHDLQCNHHSRKTINSSCSSLNECIGNLICLSGICQCPSDEYYWNTDTCIEKKSANERCSEHSHCKTPLQCLQNVCHCMNTEYWNGSICKSQTTHDSSCLSSDECIGTLFCIHGQCKCDRTDYWSGSLCVPKKSFNSTCITNEQCDNKYRCINNICRCTQSEILNGTQCLSYKNFNSTCNINEHCRDPLLCISNVCTCIQAEYWNGMQCLSKNTHDSSCVSSDECLGTLFCIHGQCRCDRTDYWSGSLCVPKKSFNSTCDTNEQCENIYRCIDNICKCTQAEIVSGTQCLSYKNFNSTCTINEHCRDPLLCISNVCTCIQAKYWNGIQCLPKKLECEDIEDTKDGVYTIYPGAGDKAVDVYCIMGQLKKWTVIQTRVNGSVDFYRTWQEYKDGFGSVYGEYWLGNEYIHRISTNGHHELSIFMQAGSEHRMANYSTFSVGDENAKYQLTVTGYSGDAGADCMDTADVDVRANGQPFTTKDRDNDNHVGNCAVKYKSAWWFNNCFYSDFNRVYSGSSGKMFWAWFSGNIGKSILMIRRTS